MSNIKALLAAAAADPKPEVIKIGKTELRVRRFNGNDRAEFFEHSKAMLADEQGVTKEWVIAYGLANDDNSPCYADPSQGAEDVRALALDDQDTLYALVMKKLGIVLKSDAEKKA